MPMKQMNLIDVPEVRPVDLETDADRQERYRLRGVELEQDRLRHQRWQEHNARGANIRECPCQKCKKLRRARK